MDTQFDIQVVIHKGENGFWATVAQLPGVFAAGKTHEELVECLEEAIHLYLEETGIPESLDQVEVQNFSVKDSGLVPA
jgi:predicted RNase H-like HicB family nuclease